MRFFEVFEKSRSRASGTDRQRQPEKRYERIYIKLLRVITLCTIIPCIIICLFTNAYVRDVVVNKHMLSYLDSIYENIQESINGYINQISAYSMYIFADKKIYSFYTDRTLSYEQKKCAIQDYLNTYWSNNELVANVDIFVDEDRVIRKKDERIEAVSRTFTSKLSRNKVLISDDIVRSETGEEYLVFGREVFNLDNGKKLFDLLLYIPESRLSEALSEFNKDNNLIFVTSNDKVILHTDKSKLGHYVLSPVEGLNPNATYQTTGDYFYGNKDLKIQIATEDSWKIESRMDNGWMYEALNRFNMEITVLLIVSILFSLILSLIIPNSMLKSIITLKKRMNGFVTNGGLKKQGTEITLPEIKELEDSFNKMSVQINDLIEKNNKEKEIQRRTELKALQAQINPHFIYNALDAIAWYAKIEKQSYIAEMICQLATFFRISLHRGDSIITLREEIAHLESYAAIEKLRYPDLFSISYKIQENLMDIKVLKIILQPVVENSIKHGFEDMSEGGEINITAYQNSGDLIIEIEDNGKGTDVNPLVTGSKKGYGIYNIDERIKLTYGEGYGVQFKSVIGKGTIVKLKMKVDADI